VDSNRQSRLIVRARGRILAIRDAIAQHGAYFDEGASN
jgi:hypothetical protein